MLHSLCDYFPGGRFFGKQDRYPLCIDSPGPHVLSLPGPNADREGDPGVQAGAIHELPLQKDFA